VTATNTCVAPNVRFPASLGFESTGQLVATLFFCLLAGGNKLSSLNSFPPASARAVAEKVVSQTREHPRARPKRFGHHCIEHPGAPELKLWSGLKCTSEPAVAADAGPLTRVPESHRQPHAVSFAALGQTNRLGNGHWVETNPPEENSSPELIEDDGWGRAVVAQTFVHKTHIRARKNFLLPEKTPFPL